MHLEIMQQSHKGLNNKNNPTETFVEEWAFLKSQAIEHHEQKWTSKLQNHPSRRLWKW